MTSAVERKTEKIEVRVTPTLKNRLRYAADKENVNMSQYIERLIRRATCPVL